MSSLDPTPVMSTSRNGSGSMSRPPGENDVIVGPGCSKHPGNVKFRNLIKAYKRARIQTNPKIDTIQAVKEVVAFWRNLSPRGRFLAQSKTDGQWQEVDESQTMRIASFFLMSSNERGELKRQKSVDAMRDVKKASAVTSMGRDPLSSSSHHGQLPVQPVQSQQRIKRPSGQQDMMGLGDFEPVPIGPVRSKSASAKSMGGAFDCGPDKTQSGMNMMGFGSGKPQNNNNFNRMSQDFHEPTKPKAQPKLDPDFGNFDFNPIPLGKDDDLFDPLPADFGMSSGSGNSKGQFGGSPSQQQQDQLQLSVNMVVPGSANFQLTTDTGNASIQISTSQGQIQGMGDQQQHQSQQKQQQSQKLMGMGMNPNGNGSSGSHNNAGIGGHQPQMNDLGFFGGGDNNSSSGGNGSMMGASGNGNGSSRNSANAMMMGNTNNGMAMNQMMGQNNGGNMMMNMNGQNTRAASRTVAIT
ncbi:expressed unknown protein [Seminavis robusta]|uniref:DUF6824 domain-containing protein n=1 Tax=Seminavis robusta TaxID=568900 RepID=A0A9N8EP67_9STRA|nr:expressed unknown protein [Seminavis robusta]|eukprot:Sro1515_g278990.1 n/a (466) ;mRNA; r:5080-6609